MKKHIIWRGFHRPFPFRILGLNKIEDYIFKKGFTFTESCKYNLYDEDQLDWNKLYGVSFGLFGIHKNSVRFVWRYDLYFNAMNIGAYWYIDGVRNFKELCSLSLNKQYNFKLTFLDNKVIFTILDEYIAIGKYILEMDANVINKNKYECGIYFGGNRRAPQRIEIVEHKIN